MPETTPFTPKRRRSSSEAGVPEGVTANTQIWTLPKGALPPHPRYHPTWLFFKQHDKAEECAVNEVLVYRVFEILAPGLCPPTYYVEYEGKPASLMRWVGKSVREANDARGKWGNRRQFTRQETRDYATMMVVDALTGHYDRHPGNWMHKGGRLVPIDHGYAFADSHPFGRDVHLSPSRVKKDDLPTYWRRVHATLTKVAENAEILAETMQRGNHEQGGYFQITANEILTRVDDARRDFKRGERIRY